MSIRTYKYKLYDTKRLKHIHNTVNISGIIYNHCIALHKRYYKLYGKHGILHNNKTVSLKMDGGVTGKVKEVNSNIRNHSTGIFHKPLSEINT